MPEPQRANLDWTEPTAPAVARWLRAQTTARSGNPAARLVLVPTQQAGRRLRAALAGGPMPRILTPAFFLQPSGDDLADPLESALVLAAELAGPRAARQRALFPAGVPARSFAERLGLARSLRALQAELAEHGLTPAEAADRLENSGDAARWRELARLLDAADAELGRAGRRDRETARLERARNPALPPDVEEVIVAAIADLQPIVALALTNLRTPVTVLEIGPGDGGAFDAWGRPSPAHWNDRDPGWSDFDAQVQLVTRPDALPESLGTVDEIGLLDRELQPALTEAMAAEGRALHDPTGVPLTAHWLVRTLGEFAALVEDATFPGAVDLLRNGAARAWLAARAPDGDAEAALAAADRVRAAHFPATVRAARPWASGPLRAALAPIEAALADLRSRPLAAGRKLAQELAAAFEPALEPAERELLTAALVAVEAAFDRLERAAPSHPRLAAADWLLALRETLAGIQLYPPRPAEAVEASGWLELPWSEAPHLLLAGFNLGRVPAPLGGELLLNEAARASLALPGAADRLARDAYFLARLLALRPGGTLRVLVGQLDAEGSPLQPSPLLFAGAADDLPARVETLFSDPRPPRPDPAWAAGWRLDPPVVELKRAISVTDFERYLDCPFTYYLGRGLRLQTFAPAADELDAAQFGDLIHYALENWARDETDRRSSDPAILTRALDAHVDAWTRENLGARLSLPLRVQVDSARARLAAFANWQAADRRDGWRIRDVETNFPALLGRPWEVDGWTISGRVDRLDENENDGRWRLVDYKTYDAPDSPAKKHLRAFRTAGRVWPPPYARVPDSADWWINLQLPLYRQVLIESGREPAQVTGGYFNLPKTISETALQTWDALGDDPGLQESALVCARGVLADLARRKFWPPNPRAAHPDFAEFLPPDATRVIDPEGAFVRSCAP